MITNTAEKTVQVETPAAPVVDREALIAELVAALRGSSTEAIQAQAAKVKASAKKSREARELEEIAQATTQLVEVSKDALWQCLTDESGNTLLPAAAGGMVLLVPRNPDAHLAIEDIRVNVVASARWERVNKAIANSMATTSKTGTTRNPTVEVVVTDPDGRIAVYNGKGCVTKALAALGVMNYYSKTHKSGPSTTNALADKAHELTAKGYRITINHSNGVSETLD